MIWARMLAYMAGTVDQELLLRNEYLAAENRILRAQIKDRLLLCYPMPGVSHRLLRNPLPTSERPRSPLVVHVSRFGAEVLHLAEARCWLTSGLPTNRPESA
jgi:hypothetical protein